MSQESTHDLSSVELRIFLTRYAGEHSESRGSGGVVSGGSLLCGMWAGLSNDTWNGDDIQYVGGSCNW